MNANGFAWSQGTCEDGDGSKIIYKFDIDNAFLRF